MLGRIPLRRLVLVFSLALLFLSVCYTVSAAGPTLGSYADANVLLGANTTVTPSAAPNGATRVTVATSTNFKGKLEGDPATGVVRITDAHPAGAYTLTVTAFDGGGSATKATFTLTVTTPATCSPVAFAAASNFGVGTNPRSVVVGDFNGDGRQDLAAANLSSNNVSSLLGDGAGGFSAANNFNAGTSPQSLAVGDFDGDGTQDLAVANQDSGDVSVLLGNGEGGFNAATNLAVGTTPLSVAVGDFNGDGKQDLAVANVNSSDVSILLGDGTGAFGAATNFAGSKPRFIAVGDFNGDGKQDLVTANANSNNVSVLLGDGAGGFGAATNFAVGAAPFSVVVGNFNGDGKQDLAVANRGSDNVSVLLGDGAGAFGAATNFGVGTEPTSVVVGDFDGDGKQDLATANQISNNVSVLLGDGAGSFGAAINFAAGTLPVSVAVGDFDGDGKQDLVTANANSNDASVLLRQCVAPATFNVTNTNDSGAGSLRQAILDANASTQTTDTITFNIPGAGVHTISPTSALPDITDPVRIDGYTQPGASANTSAAGTNAVLLIELNGAGAGGVGLNVTAGNSTVRGLVINRFSSLGVALSTKGGDTIAGNFIGTSADGSAGLGNGQSGVFVNNVAGNTVGGASLADRNLISGNGGHGVYLNNTGATANVVADNLIGTNAAGTGVIGNSINGVNVENSSNNLIGGATSAERNVISGNTRNGVGIVGPGATGNTIRGNSISANGGLGIDLGADGVTANDANDSDTGPNNLQNFPVITSADSSGGSTTIKGTLNSTASTTFRVEFFSNPSCDTSGNGEGKTFLGSTSVTTDAGGNAAINATLPAALTASDRVTATATNATTGDTSEFSPCVAPVVTATWTGALSTDWHAAGNWDTNAVPTAANPVRIPTSGVTNEPTISSADAAAASVTIQAGRTLSMQSGRTLTATTVTLDAGGALNVGAGQSAGVNADMTVNGTLAGGAGSVFNFVGASFTNGSAVSVATLRFGGTTQTLSGAGAITSASTVLLPGSTVTLASDQQLGGLSINGGATFDQGATFNLTAGNLLVSAGGTFKNLGTGDLTLKGDVSNSGTVRLDGGGAACGDADSILIRSSPAGTQRAWSGAGAFSLTDVDVRDQAGSAAVQVLSGTNSGNNGPNWTFSTCGGVPLTFSIGGRVADASNQPLLGINIHIGGSATGDTTTDAAGNYSFKNLQQNGGYTLTPTENGYRFTPQSRAVSNLQADQTGVDFTGALVNHTINGSVVDAQGAGLPGVTVTLAGSFSAVTRTDAAGNFSFTNIPEQGSFVVTAEREGFDFNPAHQQVAPATSDVQFRAVGTPQASPTPTPDQSDDFSGGPDPDPNKWAVGILTNPPPAFDPLVRVFTSGGLLHVQPRPDANGPSYSGLVSLRALDLGSTPIVSVEVVQAAQGAGAETIFGLGTNSDNWFRFVVQDNTPAPTPTPTPSPSPTPTPSHSTTTGATQSAKTSGTGDDSTAQTLFFQFSIGGQKFSTGVPYDPAQQRFWRFRHDAPARFIIFETSPDAATWTERFRAALAPDQTSLIAELSAGTLRPSPAPVEALFDNFLISPSPRMQFTASAFNAREADGAARVHVIRTGSDESPVAVNFATSDGTARAGSDYTPTSVTLLFGIGERTKTVNIPLTDDNVRETDETVNLDLTGPVGGRLGSITHAVLTILDDDQNNNPLDQTAFFVRQHYLDFLGREPDDAGLKFWTNNIESCGADSQCREAKRIDTSAAFFLSIEFQQTGYVVERFYEASFGRPAKFSEYLPDLTVMRDGVVIGQPGADARLALNKQLFAGQWVSRAAFKQAFGQLNEMQYVDALAANAGVKLSEEDRTALVVGLLTGRETRAGVLLQMVENEDFARRDFNAAFVRMQYFGYLRRDPDDAGFNFWLSKLNRFGDFHTAEMVKAFLSSTEYRSRFGQP